MKQIFVLVLIQFFLLSAYASEGLNTSTNLSLKSAQITSVDKAWTANLPSEPERATELYLQRIPAQATERANSYFEGGYWLIFWNYLLGIALAWILLSTNLSAWLRTKIENWTKYKNLQIFIYSLIYFISIQLASFPLTIYQSFFREKQYGLLNQTFFAWLNEQLIASAIGLIIGGITITVIYFIIRKLPNSWPTWGSFIAVSIFVLIVLISPIWLAPLFNTYKPLAPGPIRESVLSLARGNGIPANEVYEYDASKQTDRISANVSGVFSTMVISLNDNLLKRASLPEIKSVMAHEMGHYVLNHVFIWLIFVLVIVFLGFTFISHSFNWLIIKFNRWNIRSINDIAGLPLVIALFSTYLFVLTPINNTIVRSQETEADIFGLNAAREPDGFAEISLKLTEYRKPNPGPIEEFIFFDHPSTRSRIFMAMRWKSEQLEIGNNHN